MKIGQIYFYKNTGRLLCDALDTYYYLLSKDKEIADQFLLKASGAEKEIDNELAKMGLRVEKNQINTMEKSRIKK